MRKLITQMPGELKVYEVELVNGPFDGKKAYASHQTVWRGGELYIMGADERFYHKPTKVNDTN